MIFGVLTGRQNPNVDFHERCLYAYIYSSPADICLDVRRLNTNLRTFRESCLLEQLLVTVQMHTSAELTQFFRWFDLAVVFGAVLVLTAGHGIQACHANTLHTSVTLL